MKNYLLMKGKEKQTKNNKKGLQSLTGDKNK